MIYFLIFLVILAGIYNLGWFIGKANNKDPKEFGTLLVKLSLALLVVVPALVFVIMLLFPRGF